MKVIVIGGGAAGFFAAINIAEKHPNYQVTILEKSSKLLAKVKVSGGGRCNVTNARTKPSELVPFYPRGNKKLHPLFKKFSSSDMVAWLNQRGVETKAEGDLRMFPVTDDSQTIIDCFLKEAKKHGVTIQQNEALTQLEQRDGEWMVHTKATTYNADKVIVATGSSTATWKLLENLELELTDLVPSLFTFNITDSRLQDLQGISFDHAQVKVTGTKLEESGPLLITHWGLSGPAVLKLSSRGAYKLAEKKYQFDILINFTGTLKSDEIRTRIMEYAAANPKRKVINYPLFELPKRFWERVTSHCEIGAETPFMELSKKHLNKLVEELGQGRYEVDGKSTFKEEFVTAGGIKLSEVDLSTFECKRFPNLYLAGEVLDIDALTGGFNFQACWSAGWVISKCI
ncbi:aminoacetone oxidase family FAD-binding enzyme [Ekhidna sp.]|uniref:aminoacetone oxidase family FAD-binding enzyme n=1 Tax=Ekhidna sp. TaxID=2608089 RepID=UPI003CCC40EC